MASALSQLETASTWSPLRSAWANTTPAADDHPVVLPHEQVGEAVDRPGTRLRLEDPEDGHVDLLVARGGAGDLTVGVEKRTRRSVASANGRKPFASSADLGVKGRPSRSSPTASTR